MAAPTRKRTPFHTKSVDLGRCLLANVDNDRGARSCGRRIVPVILVDTNLLIFAHVSSFPQHAPVRN